MAPELCDLDSELAKENEASDVWAMGITAYCLIYNKLPWYHENEYAALNLI